MLLWVLILIYRVLQVIHITCNMGSWDLPDMYALGHTYQANPSCPCTTYTYIPTLQQLVNQNSVFPLKYNNLLLCYNQFCSASQIHVEFNTLV